MRLRWTTLARQDLAAIVRYIRKDSPSAAARVRGAIVERLATLVLHPESGRLGEVPETREIIFARWPYIIVYTVELGEIIIIRVRHSSQEWP